MTRVLIGLTSTNGDRIGHLVRGVQMLRSYGNEAHVVSYFDVINDELSADSPAALHTVLECTSEAELDALKGICRETEWALGKDPTVLTVTLLKFGDQQFEAGAPALRALAASEKAEGTQVFTTRQDFARMCDWGQVLPHEETDVIGEWPSATGR